MLAQDELVRPVAYQAQFADGRRQVSGDGAPSFTISIPDQRQLDAIMEADDYTAAMGFLRGEFDIAGDLVAAFRYKRARSRSGFRDRLHGLAARLSPARLATWFQSQRRAAANIRFHYAR